MKKFVFHRCNDELQTRWQ